MIGCATTEKTNGFQSAWKRWIDQLVGTTPILADEATDAPFMNQIAVLPLLSRQRMSCLPSPLKSAVPTSDQLVGTTPILADEEIDVPFKNQIAVLPFASRQRMSCLPSPS